MNDPHVVALVYRIGHDASIDYREAKPLYRDEDAFRLSVIDAQARFEMKHHYSTFEEAEEAIVEYIHAWEFDVQLKRGPDSFRLDLDRENSEIIDRNPTPGVENVLVSDMVRIADTAEATVLAGEYPDPPSDIVLNLDAEVMHQRYLGYCRGREPLGSMAYFCLTILEKSVGGRRAAAQMYDIDYAVLKMIGEWTANKGGLEARKAGGVREDFSSGQYSFLEDAVKAIIRRVAEREHSPSGRLARIWVSNRHSLNPILKIETKDRK